MNKNEREIVGTKNSGDVIKHTRLESRRSILKKAVGLGVVASTVGLGLNMSRPRLAEAAETIKLKAQSAWPAGPGHHAESADYFANALNRITGGKLLIPRMHSAGELVGTLETIPAVSAGKLDLVHGSMLYMVGKIPEAGFVVGTQASPIKSYHELVSWWWANLDLYSNYIQEKGFNIVAFPCGLIESEPVWSNKPIRSLKDFKGLKIRTSGLSLDFYNKVGCSTVTMPLSEVVPSLEKGVIDACEFCVPYTDYPAGVHKTCQYVLTGLNHQPSLCLELFVNLSVWKQLPDDLKQLVKDAVQITNAHYITDITTYNTLTWVTMIKEGRKGGLIVSKADELMQKKFFDVGADMAREWSAKIPWVKKVIESQTVWHNKYSDYFGTYYRLGYLV